MKSGGNVPYALDAELSLNSGMPMLGNLRVPLPSWARRVSRVCIYLRSDRVKQLDR